MSASGTERWSCLAEGGMAGERLRAIDWSDNPLGPMAAAQSRHLGLGEAARLATLARYDGVGMSRETDSLDQVAHLAAHLFGMPVVFVSLIVHDAPTGMRCRRDE